MAKMQGGFRVVDSWQGLSKDKTQQRASVTVSDIEQGGQMKLSFEDGKIPADIRPDTLLTEMIVRPQLASFGQMLFLVSWAVAKSK